MVKLQDGEATEFSQGFALTTNNRMELMAVIAALESVDSAARIQIFSDSKYVVEALNLDWARKWRAAGWTRKGSNPVANADLWQRLLDLDEQFDISYEWVKGHAGNKYNERADALSYQAIAGADKQEDDGFASQSSGAVGASAKITEAGQPCRKCGTPVEKKVPRRKLKPDQTYYFEYYLQCPNCKTNYMVEEAKRYINQDSMF